VLDEAHKMAHTIAAMPPAAILSAKKLLRHAMDLNLNETLEAEKKVFQNCQKEHEHFLAVTKVMEQIRGK
jgi:enoyl-CoA hydratase/carnithine racemase